MPSAGADTRPVFPPHLPEIALPRSRRYQRKTALGAKHTLDAELKNYFPIWNKKNNTINNCCFWCGDRPATLPPPLPFKQETRHEGFG